jgi:hypothetical protein
MVMQLLFCEMSPLFMVLDDISGCFFEEDRTDTSPLPVLTGLYGREQ